MIRRTALIALCLAATAFAAPAQDKKKKQKKEQPAKPLYNGEPIRALLVTGGCCHNYLFQTFALTDAAKQVAKIEWDIVKDGGNGTAAEIDLYSDPDWAERYDVVVHNECFAKTTNLEYIRSITEAHKAGVPAVVIHCAMHTYRDAEIDDWRQFLGVTSRKHEHQAEYAVTVKQPDHPIMVNFPSDWKTPMDELYIVDKIWPDTKVIATSLSEKDGSEHPVIWVNEFAGNRVAGTTYGHSDDTFRDPVFLQLLARSIAWASGKGKEK